MPNPGYRGAALNQDGTPTPIHFIPAQQQSANNTQQKRKLTDYPILQETVCKITPAAKPKLTPATPASKAQPCILTPAPRKTTQARSVSRSTTPRRLLPDSDSDSNETPQHYKHDTRKLVHDLREEAQRISTASSNEQHDDTECPYDRIRHIPKRLLDRLMPVPKSELMSTRKDYGIPEGQILLILYAGKDDSTSLEAAIQNAAPWLSPNVFAVDKCRDINHDMLALGMYSHLYWKAMEGDILAIIGGPPRETWQHDPNNIMRGTEYGQVWGRKGLDGKQWEQVDDESTLVLRQMAIYEAAVQGNPDCKFLMEHPAARGFTSSDDELPSIWGTSTIRSFQTRHNMIMTTFSLCNLGADANIPTALITKNMPGIRKLNNWNCKHRRHTGDTAAPPERWPWGLNCRISTSLKDSMLWLKEYMKRNGLPDSNRDNVRH